MRMHSCAYTLAHAHTPVRFCAHLANGGCAHIVSQRLNHGDQTWCSQSGVFISCFYPSRWWPQPKHDAGHYATQLNTMQMVRYASQRKWQRKWWRIMNNVTLRKSCFQDFWALQKVDNWNKSSCVPERSDTVNALISPSRSFFISRFLEEGRGGVGLLENVA